MAMRQQQQQDIKEAQNASLPSEISPDLEQKIPRGKELEQELKEKGPEFVQEQVIGVEDYEEEQEEEFHEQERDSRLHAESNEQEKACSVRTQLRTENSPVHLHSQVEGQHSASSGHSSKDPEVFSLPSMPAMPSNADLLASLDVMGTFASFPSKQVEGALQSCLTSAEGQVTRLLQQAMDTVQSQVLQALHQAASDIIEHLGKEAAHRVVVAEHKAALLELELSSVKQQALSMLLRLKADSDAQALDADKKYLLERRRAQDAETKLSVAQDTSKRLKSELKKKGDILDKMQKLVQPTTEYHSQNPSRSMELTGRLESCLRGISSDRRRKLPVCSVEATAFMMYNAASHHEVQGTEVHPDIEAAVQATDDNEKQSSFSSKTQAAGENSLELQKQTCSSNGTLQTSQWSPYFQEEGLLSGKIDEGTGDILLNDQVELSGQAEGPHQVESLEASLAREDKPIEHMCDTKLLPDTEFPNEKDGPVLAVCQKNVDGENVIQGSPAAVKGFYVRRKVRENGKLQEKKDLNLAAEKHCVNVVLEHVWETDGLIRSSSETASKLKTDILEGDHRTFNVQRESQVLLDGTDSSSLLGHVVQCGRQLAAESHEDLAGDLQEEISSSEFSKGVDLGSSTTRDEVATKILECARPDYEVATSLAELASIGLEVRSQEMESLPHIGTPEGIFLKPGRTGLRMKRKGISFERKLTLQSEGKVNKKPRPDKLDSGLTDSQTERVLRRNRGGKYSILKDSLSLESSRDNRRLMQGARQLLCLAEKKWR